MSSITRDFVSQESRKFHFKLGKHLASALSGFVVGVVVASVVWLIGVWYMKQVQQIVPSTPPPASLQALTARTPN